MKNKKTKRIIIGIIILLVVILVIRYIRSRKNNASPEPSVSSGSTSGYTSSTGSSSVAACTNSTILKRGSDCDRVQWSQWQINQVRSAIGQEKLTEDGKFGAKTEAAFQKLLGKKTGSWNDVQAKAKTLQGSSSQSASQQESNWYDIYNPYSTFYN